MTQTEKNRKELLEQNLDTVFGYYTLGEIIEIEAESIETVKKIKEKGKYDQPKIKDEYIFNNLVSGLDELYINDPLNGRRLKYNEEPMIEVPAGRFKGMEMPAAYWQKYFATEQGTYLFYLISTGTILMPELPWGLGNYPQTNINMYDTVRYLNWVNQIKNPHLFSPKDNEVLYYVTNDNKIYIDIEAHYLPGVQRIPFVEEYNRVAEPVRSRLAENVEKYVDEYCLYHENTNGVMPERNLIDGMIKPCPEYGIYNIFGGTWPTAMDTGPHNPYHKEYREKVLNKTKTKNKK